MRKNHCSIRKNTIRNNHFIQELTPRIPPAMTNSTKNLLLGLKFIIWLCVLFSLAKPLASNNCCKTHHQPNSFIHFLTNLLYWTYWAHILFYLNLGYDLWPYRFIYNLSPIFFFLNLIYIKGTEAYNPKIWLNMSLRLSIKVKEFFFFFWIGN